MDTLGMAPVLAQLQEENRTLREALAEREAQIFRLELRVKDLAAQIYGPSSEKSRRQEDARQATIAGIEEEAGAEQEKFFADASAPEKKSARPAAKPTGKKKGPKSLPPHLPRQVIPLPDPDLRDLICPETGKPMKPAFQQRIEVLSRKPAEYFVSQYVRNVFVSEAKTAPVTTPWPSHVLTKARVDVSIVSDMLVKRYLDHQPFHRQEQQFSRLGLEISRTTMISWAKQAEALAEPLVKVLRDVVLKRGYIQVDATPIEVNDPERPGKTREACIWAYRALDGPVYFEFALSKNGTTPGATLRDFTGTIQTDGANNFGGVTEKEGVTHLGCWVHGRRYFFKADQAGETEAGAYVETIDKLFRIERLARHFKLGDENTITFRKRHSLPIVDRLVAMARQHLADRPLLKKTRLCKAVSYLLGQEKPLRACFAVAPSRIDNNLVENAIRPLKLGENNWLFIGNPKAGPRAAALFTLMQNCRLAGLNPEEYLTDLFTRMPASPAKKIADFLPQNWLKSKNTAQAQA
jgi:transposase